MKAKFMFRKIPRQTKADGCARKLLRFGDLITAVYERCGKASANGLLRLATNARLVAFPEGQRFVIVKRGYGRCRFKAPIPGPGQPRDA